MHQVGAKEITVQVTLFLTDISVRQTLLKD